MKSESETMAAFLLLNSLLEDVLCTLRFWKIIQLIDTVNTEHA